MHRRIPPLAIAALLAFGCTPPLTADDAAPYQSCTQDSDCTVDSLECGGCNFDIAVAVDEQTAFDEFRGCWPPSTQIDCPQNTDLGEFGCTVAVCSAGRCQISQNTACDIPPGSDFGTVGSSGTTESFGSTSSGFNGSTSSGFGTTTANTTTGGAAGDTGSSAGGPPDGGFGTTSGIPDAGFDGGGA